MHYKNGRPANNGDKVLLLPTYGAPVVGILYDATAGNDHCNGKLAPCNPNDPCPDLKNCIHIEDVAAASVKGIPNSMITVPKFDEQ
jgi:hypothetical protein